MDNREKYDGIGFFTRLARMCRGLGQPRTTAAYKLARVELQRLSAPVAALTAVGLVVAAGIVLTAATESVPRDEVIVLAEPEPEIEPIDDPPEPPEVGASFEPLLPGRPAPPPPPAAE